MTSITVSIWIAIIKEIPLLYLILANFFSSTNLVFAIILIGLIAVKKLIYTFSENYILLSIIRELPLFSLLILCIYNFISVPLMASAMVAFWIEDIGDYLIESILLENILDLIDDFEEDEK